MYPESNYHGPFGTLDPLGVEASSAAAPRNSDPRLRRDDKEPGLGLVYWALESHILIIS